MIIIGVLSILFIQCIVIFYFYNRKIRKKLEEEVVFYRWCIVPYYDANGLKLYTQRNIFGTQKEHDEAEKEFWEDWKRIR